MPKLPKLIEEELIAIGGPAQVLLVKKRLKYVMKDGHLSEVQANSLLSAFLYKTNGKDAFKV